MTNHTLSRRLAGALACSLAASAVLAQTVLPIAPVKPQGNAFLREFKAVYVPPLRTYGASRLHDMIRAGTLYLSVHDALELAVENNLDLEIARYDVGTSAWSVQRAESGGPLRGVTTGSGSAIRLGSGQGVAGSQGRSSSGGAGGTATVTGAALIQQIGPVTPQLDPISSTSIGLGHQTSIQDQVVQAGANYFAFAGRSYNEQISEGLLSGGTVRYSYGGSYLNEGVPLDVINPTSYIGMSVSISHNLLSGYGQKVNGRFIRVARRQAANTNRQFESRLMTAVTNVLNLYWDLSVATDDLRYKERNLELAQELLSNTRKLIAAGAVPSIDQVRAQSNAALQDRALTVARDNVVQRENALKDALSWHGRQDAELETAHIVTTDPLNVPKVEDIPPLNVMVETANKLRPDIAIARSQAELAQINASGTANGLLPSLRVFANTQNVGQAGTAVPGAGADPYFVGGAGSALSQVLRRNFPNERVASGFSANLQNTQAQADNAIDQLTHRQRELGTQRTFNDLARDISLQRLALEQASARYHSAIQSRQLIEKLLQGEEKQWQAGTSSLAIVVQARRDLADAQSRELAAAAAFVRNQIALDQALGQTLERNDIKVEDALK